MSSSQFEREVGFLVALELHEDNPSLTLQQMISEVDTQLFRIYEPLLTRDEIQGMQDYYGHRAAYDYFFGEDAA